MPGLRFAFWKALAEAAKAVASVSKSPWISDGLASASALKSCSSFVKSIFPPDALLDAWTAAANFLPSDSSCVQFLIESKVGLLLDVVVGAVVVDPPPPPDPLEFVVAVVVTAGAVVVVAAAFFLLPQPVAATMTTSASAIAPNLNVIRLASPLGVSCATAGPAPILDDRDRRRMIRRTMIVNPWIRNRRPEL